MRAYVYYLFDADGTLFDTTELIYQCFVYSCRKYGNRDVTREEVIPSIGLTLAKQFERHLGPLPAAQLDAIQTDHMDYQLAIYRRYLRPFPGVAESLSALKARGGKLAVVSSRKMRSLGLYLRETGLYDYFDAFVTPDDTAQHKPDPAPAHKAMDLLGAVREQTVIIGDAVFDIACGQSAGIDTVFVSWSHHAGALQQVRPTFVINNMHELCVP